MQKISFSVVGMQCLSCDQNHPNIFKHIQLANTFQPLIIYHVVEIQTQSALQKHSLVTANRVLTVSRVTDVWALDLETVKRQMTHSAKAILKGGYGYTGVH